MTMKKQDTASMFALIRSGLSGKPLEEAERAALDLNHLPKWAALAKKHDLAHLLMLGLKNNGLDSEKTEFLERSILEAVYRNHKQYGAIRGILEVLEQEGIPFMPLKGAVISGYYREEWLRTSCDIDILVREEDFQRATVVLEGQCGCVRQCSTSHDVSFRTFYKTSVELHHTLIEPGYLPEAARVLERIWDRAYVVPGTKCQYVMPEELLYFYHIAHMAKHIIVGGCGIRPFLDLWIMDQVVGKNWYIKDEQLEEGGLLKFAQRAQALSQAWFENGPMDPTLAQLEEYVLRGGVYGNRENRVSVQQQRRGGRLRYLLSRAFLPFATLKNLFPVLHKYPWLMPVMQVYRWLRLLFGGGAKRVAWELAYSRGISAEETDQTRIFLENIGLTAE